MSANSPSQPELLQLTGNWPQCREEPVFVEALEQEVLPAYLQKCRWFAGKAQKLQRIQLLSFMPFPVGKQEAFFALLQADYHTGKSEQYLLPLTVAAEAGEAPELALLCRLNAGYLIDAIYDADFRMALYDAFAGQRDFATGDQQLRFEKGSAFVALEPQERSSRVLKVDQSNTSVFFGDSYFFKLYRKLFRHTNPELELVRHLSEHSSFRQIPVYAGSISLHQANQAQITLGILQQKVSSEGDAWGLFQGLLARFLASEGVQRLNGWVQDWDYLAIGAQAAHLDLATQYLDAEALTWIQLLGSRTADMHNALVSDENEPAFCPVGFDDAYRQWLANHFEQLMVKRQQLLADVGAALPLNAQPLAEAFLAGIHHIQAQFDAVQQLETQSLRIRIHGDYHLGQVLHEQGDYIILDFEGEPESSVSDRKVKHSPLKDVAGMLRSFHYAAYAALYFSPGAASLRAAHPEAEALAEKWFQLVASVYLGSYLDRLDRQAFQLQNESELISLLRIHLLEKAVYEFGYELNGRPDWVIIPLKGIQQIIGTQLNPR